MEIEDGNIGHVKEIIKTRWEYVGKKPYSIYFVMTLCMYVCMYIYTSMYGNLDGKCWNSDTPQALNSLNGSKRTIKWTCRQTQTQLGNPSEPTPKCRALACRWKFDLVKSKQIHRISSSRTFPKFLQHPSRSTNEHPSNPNVGLLGKVLLLQLLQRRPR